MTGWVVHVYGDFPYDRYVGRPASRVGLPGSDLANPHKIGPGCSREEAVTRFELGLRAAVETDPKWRERVLRCQGLALACWCAGKAEVLTTDDPIVCHAQVILKVADDLAVAG